MGYVVSSILNIVLFIYKCNPGKINNYNVTIIFNSFIDGILVINSFCHYTNFQQPTEMYYECPNERLLIVFTHCLQSTNGLSKDHHSETAQTLMMEFKPGKLAPFFIQ